MLVTSNLPQNLDYDDSQPYILRSERPEWDVVGMLGQLIGRDDGTCKVNEYCAVRDGGIVTASQTGYRVLARIWEGVVKILFR